MRSILSKILVKYRAYVKVQVISIIYIIIAGGARNMNSDVYSGNFFHLY